MLFTPLKPMLLMSQKVKSVCLVDNNFLYEPKYDGWRILAHKEGDRVDLYTRHGNCVTDRFPELRAAVERLPVHSTILDAEGVCFDPNANRPDFSLFSARGKLSNRDRITDAARQQPATLIPFDVLMVNGNRITQEPLLARKERLASIVSNGPGIMLPSFVEGNGQSLFDWTKQNHWEGIVCKVKTSRYVYSRSDQWIKWKHTIVTNSAVIMGYRTKPFALLVGLRDKSNQALVSVTLIKFGFTHEEKQAFLRLANQLHTQSQHGTQMIQPVLRCKIEYLEKTSKGSLRTGVFRGFLLDGEESA